MQENAGGVLSDTLMSATRSDTLSILSSATYSALPNHLSPQSSSHYLTVNRIQEFPCMKSTLLTELLCRQRGTGRGRRSASQDGRRSNQHGCRQARQLHQARASSTRPIAPPEPPSHPWEGGPEGRTTTTYSREQQ